MAKSRIFHQTRWWKLERQRCRYLAGDRLCRFPKGICFFFGKVCIDKMIDQYLQKGPDNGNGEQRGEDDEFGSEHVLKYSASRDFGKDWRSPD
ncbi:MAG: hypothetical protein K0S45_2374 [Nitrospira sp.]|nr:hypothetical protein [Nitrospira sp.]